MVFLHASTGGTATTHNGKIGYRWSPKALHRYKSPKHQGILLRQKLMQMIWFPIAISISRTQSYCTSVNALIAVIKNDVYNGNLS